jgi:hypothetical protein
VQEREERPGHARGRLASDQLLELVYRHGSPKPDRIKGAET